jgi:hypothetical protein
MTNHEEFEALGLTEAERATNFETMLHIENVRTWLRWARNDLEDRADRHDQSKLRPPELRNVEIVTGRNIHREERTDGTFEFVPDQTVNLTLRGEVASTHTETSLKETA